MVKSKKGRAQTKGTNKKAEKEGWGGRGEAGDGCRINDIEGLVLTCVLVFEQHHQTVSLFQS